MADDLKSSNGLYFINQSALQRSTIKDLAKPRSGSIPLVKEYPAAAKFPLPVATWRLSEARIQPLLQQRRSLRKYASEPVPLVNLAFILWACQGITAKTGNHLLRTSPSAGALYPVETYLSIQNVEGLESGLYHFDPHSFELALLADGDQGRRLASACLDQNFMKQAAFCFIWTGVTRRCMSKYGDRGMRYLLLDAAHICQSVLLAAEAVSCGGCPIAAFYDDEICDLLELDGVEEIVLYGASIGLKL